MGEDFTQGHRQRLRTRFLEGGERAVADYELLEMLLYAAHPRSDVKPLAKKLLHQFGTLSGVVRASTKELQLVDGMGQASISIIKVAQVLVEKVLIQEIQENPVIDSWDKLLTYCKVSMGHLGKEQFRLLFLDRKNRLIKDEIQQTGTVDQAPVYPREVVQRALEVGACALILVHNHPSGDATPSQADIDVTKRIIKAAEGVDVRIHDHLIIGKNTHTSLRAQGHI
ncbi:MAG: RadC family protein [Alphaproteobacteria bacterium]|nr:DNA repair protein RadC [Alphaproteobacteria bacterium]